MYRHLFVHGKYRYLAYTDNVFPTRCGLMSSALSVIAEMIFHSGICGSAAFWRAVRAGTMNLRYLLK